MSDPRTVPLLSARDLAKSYGAQPLFDGVGLSVFDGDRIGIVGPNGAGKSTLLRLLTGEERPDAGEVIVRKGARVSVVPQEHPFPAGTTVESVLRDALDAALPPGPDHVSESEARLAETLGRTGFTDRNAQADTLSGGWQKRLAIARALVADPDVLILDEPTNHLDFPGLRWLEELLVRGRFAVLVISHDRYFLERTATRMIELNRVYPGGTLTSDGPYSAFLETRVAFLRGQERLQETLENRLRREVEWLRRGPKARATKAQYRVDEAGRLQQERDEVAARNQSSTASFDFTGTDRKSRRLLVAKDLTIALGGRELFRDVGFVLSPGMRVGLVGPNGSGKTTLLRILAGERESDHGRVELAHGLNIVYFDQKREALDPACTLRRALCPDGDAVRYRGGEIHVTGWARRFLFRVDQLDMPIGELSGGEQARVLIARLVVRPADVLLLDEPTNDLDLSTLEILEDSLTDFPGAVVLVTHDRWLLDRVANTVLGLDGRGIATFHGDYLQWEESFRAALRRDAGKQTAAGPVRDETTGRTDRGRPKRLTYLEQRDLETVEARIAEAEGILAVREQALQDPAIASDAGRLQECMAEADAARATVETLYARWAELEAKLKDA